jgi:hypothetical protein
VLADVVGADDRRAALEGPRRARSDAAAVEEVVASASPSRRPASSSARARSGSAGRAQRAPAAAGRARRSGSTVLPNPMPGSRHTSSSRIPASTAAASRSSRNEATSETTGRRTAAPTCIVLGVPVHVHQAEYAFRIGDATPASSGSPRSAVSRSRARPESQGRGATSALDVSIESGSSPPSASRTGPTRRSSSPASTPSEPGRVDSPPTVDESRALGDHAARRGDRDSWIPVDAAVRELSGVTFRTPITDGLGNRSAIGIASSDTRSG